MKKSSQEKIHNLSTIAGACSVDCYDSSMKAYIAVGANMAHPLAVINRALHLICQKRTLRLLDLSPLYRTEAVGGPRQADYLNGVVVLETPLPPQKLMLELLEIERQLGRIRRKKWGPRLIDLDLLAMGRSLCKSKTLSLPHPRYHQRRFVLVPFCDVAPRFLHPRLGHQNRTLLRKLTLPGQRVTIAAQWNGKQFAFFKKKRRTKPLSSH